MKKLFAFICLALVMLVVTGCLSVIRVPFPEDRKFSDDGKCTNCTWKATLPKELGKDAWSCYPTIWMRCVATKQVFSPIDYTKTGEALYNEKHKYWAAVPLTVLWLTSPLDAVVDTIFLPFDLCRD